MAKKKPPRADAEQIRLATTFTRKARMIASALGMNVGEYIEDRLGPIIDAELPSVLKELGIAVEDGADGRAKKPPTKGA